MKAAAHPGRATETPKEKLHCPISECIELGQTQARADAPDQQKSLRNLVLILAAVALALGWANRLRWGLWTDEAGTYWMASQGWQAAVARTANWSGQSILYSVIESFFIARGAWLEPLLRLPWVAAAFLAAWHLKRLAELMFDAQAGWIAVLAFVCAPDVASFATSARPYAMALAASLASFRYLVEWQIEGRKSLVWRYLAASVLTLYFHYLFAFVFVSQGLYLGFCHWRGKITSLWLPAAAAVGLPLSLLPLSRSLLATARHTVGFGRAAQPEFLQLLRWCLPPLFLIALGLGIVLLLVSARNVRWRPQPVQPELVFLAAVWLLLAPIAFFVISRLTASRIFAARYMLFTVPAFVLILTWIVCGWPEARSRKTLLLAVFAGTILHPGSLMYVFHQASNSWRAPLAFIRDQSRKDPPPVFVVSGLAESDEMDWQQADPRTASLYSPLTAYPIPNRVLPLPYHFSQDAQDFIGRAVGGELAGADRLFLVAPIDSEIGPWTSSYLKTKGFAAVPTETGEYVVIDYRRTAAR